MFCLFWRAARAAPAAAASAGAARIMRFKVFLLAVGWALITRLKGKQQETHQTERKAMPADYAVSLRRQAADMPLRVIDYCWSVAQICEAIAPRRFVVHLD